MSQPPTALHRALAWCAVALLLALVAVSTRSALRGLLPRFDPEPEPDLRAEERLHDVGDDPRSAQDELEPASSPSPAIVARPPRTPQRRPQEPLEKHPAYVVEGVVHSASGTYRQRLALEVVHPGGDVAATDLHFDRRASNGVDWVARFKLVKPAQGSYLLRPKVTESWPYEFEPPELRVEASVWGVSFLLRDDMEHVDVDVVVVGAQGEELPGAHFLFEVAPLEPSPWRSQRRPDPCEPGAGPELRRVPEGLHLNWLATAPGHRSATGVFAVQSGVRRTTVRLAPGWSAILEEFSGEEPLLGEIVLDGRHWGYTDPSGTTVVAADAPPSEIQVWIGARCVLQRKVVDEDPIQPLVYIHGGADPRGPSARGN